MSIRETALRDPAFAELYRVYRDREAEAARWRDGGGRVLGKLGFDVPDELAIAAGFLPVQVYADPGRPLPLADKYLEYAFDPVVRSQFQKLTDGTYRRQLDALAIIGAAFFMERGRHAQLVRRVTLSLHTSAPSPRPGGHAGSPEPATASRPRRDRR